MNECTCRVISEYKWIAGDCPLHNPFTGTERETKWRRGQSIFNFLEWLKEQGVPGNQNARMADPFHLSNEQWDAYLTDYKKQYPDADV